jgi:hypothetical protein
MELKHNIPKEKSDMHTVLAACIVMPTKSAVATRVRQLPKTGQDPEI